MCNGMFIQRHWIVIRGAGFIHHGLLVYPSCSGSVHVTVR
jgi:hypothetical protein